MGVVVQFDLAAWRALYPQFSAVTDDQIEDLCLPIAEVACRNDGGGPVTKASIQTTLLNLMVAHVAQLNFAPTAAGITPGGSGVVGRVNSATEGSVSVQAEMAATQNSQWYLQTQYGATYWQLTAPYRTMRYVPGYPRVMNPWNMTGRYWR